MGETVEVYHHPDKGSELLQIVSRSKLLPSARPRGLRLSDQAREELVKLVQRVFVSGRPEAPQVVVFSAVKAQSGCSWTCARVVEILADLTDGLVCLVDANFRSRVHYREFQFANPGNQRHEWTFTPVSRQDRGTDDPNLWLLSFRPEPASCPTTASIKDFQVRISELREHFDYVVIDAPPLNAYAEATLFGCMADGLIMVLEANNTRRESARKAKQVLLQSDVRVLGAVLNKRVFPIPESLYRRL